jgi:hypothetical protein
MQTGREEPTNAVTVNGGTSPGPAQSSVAWGSLHFSPARRSSHPSLIPASAHKLGCMTASRCISELSSFYKPFCSKKNILRCTQLAGGY